MPHTEAYRAADCRHDRETPERRMPSPTRTNIGIAALIMAVKLSVPDSPISVNLPSSSSDACSRKVHIDVPYSPMIATHLGQRPQSPAVR